jgi:hypothetical protein
LKSGQPLCYAGGQTRGGFAGGASGRPAADRSLKIRSHFHRSTGRVGILGPAVQVTQLANATGHPNLTVN